MFVSIMITKTLSSKTQTWNEHELDDVITLTYIFSSFQDVMAF
jgi:hypothetical protein